MMARLRAWWLDFLDRHAPFMEEPEDDFFDRITDIHDSIDRPEGYPKLGILMATSFAEMQAEVLFADLAAAGIGVE